MEHPWAQARGVGLAHVRGNKPWAWAVCGDWEGPMCWALSEGPSADGPPALQWALFVLVDAFSAQNDLIHIHVHKAYLFQSNRYIWSINRIPEVEHNRLEKIGCNSYCLLLFPIGYLPLCPLPVSIADWPWSVVGCGPASTGSPARGRRTNSPELVRTLALSIAMPYCYWPWPCLRSKHASRARDQTPTGALLAPAWPFGPLAC